MEEIKLNKKVVMKPVGELHPYKGAHNTSGAITMLQESIQKYGFQQPIVIDKDNNIASGNGIYEAAVALGHTEVPCICIDYLTEEQIRQYRIADNKTAEFARWNQAKLEKEVTYLQHPDELQFCFDEDLTRMLTKEPVQIQPAVAANVPASGNSGNNQNGISEPTKTTDSGNSEPQNNRKLRDEIEKEMEAKPVEYFEYVCSNCGKKVTVKI